VVAGHSNVGKVTSACISPVEQITTLVTDLNTEPEVLAELGDVGNRIIVADPEKD